MWSDFFHLFIIFFLLLCVEWLFFLISLLMVNQSTGNSSQPWWGGGGAKTRKNPPGKQAGKKKRKAGLKSWGPPPGGGGGGPSGGCCPNGNISTIINHVWKHWGNPPTPTALQAIPDHSPINAVIISASVPAALTHTHTHTHKKNPDTKWYNSPSENEKKRKKLLLPRYLSLCCRKTSLLHSSAERGHLSTVLEPEATEGNTHRTSLLPCGTRSLWCEKKYVVSLCQSLAREATKRKEAVNSLFPAAGSFPLLFWFAVCALSVLLVMLIVSRPPAECDPFPGWVAVKLFAQADESACMLLLFLCVCVCVCLQRGATMCHKSFSYAAHVGLCVIMHVGAHQHGSPRSQPRLGTPYSPILQTLACEDGKQADVSS